MISQESRAHIADLQQSPPFGAGGFHLAYLRAMMETRREPTDFAGEVRPDVADGVPGTWVVAAGADPGHRVLYLHGGGYVSGAGAYYLPLAGHLSTTANCAVFLLDYRLAPEHPFPAAIEDCVRAHQWLRTTGPSGQAPAKSTFIAGDSAGGGLTLATLLTLRERELPLPSGAIPISAFADLTLAGETLRSEASNDPIMSPNCLPKFVDLYLGGADPRDPLASPVFADYAGVCPLLIQVGEHEIIRSDSEAVAERARADGAEVILEVWEGMIHVFQSHEPLLPEGREAVAHMAAFIRAHLER